MSLSKEANAALSAALRIVDGRLRRHAGDGFLAPVPASATGFNRYSYANNNPYRFIDPFGLWTCSGSKSYCEAFEQLLRMVKDALTDPRLNKSQQKMLSAIVDGYGAKGDDSVRVTFKGSGNSDGSTRRAVDEKTGKRRIATLPRRSAAMATGVCTCAYGDLTPAISAERS